MVSESDLIARKELTGRVKLLVLQSIYRVPTIQTWRLLPRAIGLGFETRVIFDILD